MTKLQEGKDKLDSRLSSLESPFGRIPAELPDLIKVFPILMAGLLVSVTTTLQKNNSLYISFREEFRKNNSEIDYKNFQRQADCWFLPPYTSIFQPFVLGFCIAIIAGVFVRASLLVVSEPSLFTSLTGEPVTIRKNLFLCAYIMTGIVIIGCLWLIGKISMKRV